MFPTKTALRVRLGRREVSAIVLITVITVLWIRTKEQ